MLATLFVAGSVSLSIGLGLVLAKALISMMLSLVSLVPAASVAIDPERRG